MFDEFGFFVGIVELGLPVEGLVGFSSPFSGLDGVSLPLEGPAGLVGLVDGFVAGFSLFSSGFY